MKRRILVLSLLVLFVFSGTVALAQTVWAPNVAYSVGQLVTYQDATHPNHTYKCLQAHTSQIGWEPPNVPALWQDMGAVSGGATATPVPPTRTNTPSGATATRTPTKSNTPTGPTATRTNTPIGATATKTNTPSVPTNTPKPPATATPGGTTCTAAPWNVNTAYTGGSIVYYNGHQWQAKWWTQGEIPDNNTSGVWTDLGACSGGPTPMPTVIGAGKGGVFPAHVFAPYVDVMAWPTFDLVGTTQKVGIKYYSLAFVIDGGGCIPKWGGVTGIDQNFLIPDIGTLRSIGGDVNVSFGGANGTELAQACTSVSALQAAYQSVINRYSLTWIDFDVEGTAVTDSASITRRNQAIKGLKAANPGLRVSYTLPVLPSGLTQDGLNVLNSAVANAAPIDIVNVMAMDYGAIANPNTMGANATQAATSLHNQLQTIYPSKTSAQVWAMIGITPMIGMNDVSPEVFTLNDASIVLNFANQNLIAELAFWSAGRDKQCTGTNTVSPSCSGITQSDFAFSNIFKPFTR